MIQKAVKAWPSIGRQWLVGMAKESLIIFRTAIAAGFIIILAVLEFRPSTSAQECAVFALVPLGMLVCGAHLTANLLSYLKIPPASVEPSFRVKLIAWAVVLCLFVLIAGIPSMFVFRWLGMGWADEFMRRFTTISLAGIVVAVTIIGSRVLNSFRLLARLVSRVGDSDRDKFVKCMTH